MTAGMKFEVTSFGPGSFVRFRNAKSHPWTYATYRDTNQPDSRHARIYEFSDHPLGPITRRLTYWPSYIEVAVAAGKR
ncbi:MAG: hypothetical protein LCH43_11445 [Actinobacteria bacterium]|nr:hypothetical protein [Actinomycetota bacterium]